MHLLPRQLLGLKTKHRPLELMRGSLGKEMDSAHAGLCYQGECVSKAHSWHPWGHPSLSCCLTSVQTTPGDGSQDRLRSYIRKAEGGSREGDMRSCALTVCWVLTLEHRTEPSTLLNMLLTGNKACSSHYCIEKATSGLEPSRGQILLCFSPAAVSRITPGMNLLVRN